MDKLKEIYEQFQNIMFSYEGDKTNWSKKVEELEVLYRNVSSLKLVSSKNVLFYEYIKRKLKGDIFNEINRVSQLSIKQSNKI